MSAKERTHPQDPGQALECGEIERAMLRLRQPLLSNAMQHLTRGIPKQLRALRGAITATHMGSRSRCSSSEDTYDEDMERFLGVQEHGLTSPPS